MKRHLRRVSVTASLLILVLADCGGQSRGGSTPASAPSLDDPSFELLAVGDFGTGTSTEQQVSDSMRRWSLAHPVDAFVSTGDNVYPSGRPENFDAAWNEPFGWVEEDSLEVIATLGNHDVLYGGGVAVMDLLGMPGPWYSATIGDADIVVLNANQPAESELLLWLRSVLPELKSAWQIVVFHQPAYSCAQHDSTAEVIDNWVPLFQEHGIDLVLSGHDHDYQRFAPERRVTYLVTGGGADELYKLDQCPGGIPQRVDGDDRHHFLTVEGNETLLHVTARATDDTVIDDFTLKRQ